MFFACKVVYIVLYILCGGDVWYKFGMMNRATFYQYRLLPKIPVQQIIDGIYLYNTKVFDIYLHLLYLAFCHSKIWHHGNLNLCEISMLCLGKLP